jgi:polyhydroxyalkanoate synthesis repressor PhaR
VAEKQFMPVIKRYPNRKLYDTERKQYITLEGVAALIREGLEVQVVDHTTGEDLTALTLTQIIFEQEKKRSGFLPQTVLTGLIQAGGETVGALRRALALPLDLARQVDEEIERRLQSLVSGGELAAEEGLRLRDRLLGPGHRSTGGDWPSDGHLRRILEEQGIPTHEDLQQLFDKLEVLARKLDEIAPKDRRQ